MGLGSHGGGVASASYLARHGCEVTVTDRRDESTLQDSITRLKDLPIRYVLGRHESADFSNADFVVKNPAVRPDSPYLAECRRIETDISIFLAFSKSRIIAVTGSKGKSTTSSAILFALQGAHPFARLGGNITTSPLEFLDELVPGEPVVLELSSWQLADLRGRGLLDPEVAVVLNLLRDHQDRYADMRQYAEDKRVICESQSSEHACVLNYDDKLVRDFALATAARVIAVTAGDWETDSITNSDPRRPDSRAWFSGEMGYDSIEGERRSNLIGPLALPGAHNKVNMLAAAASLVALGMSRDVCRRLEIFPGIAHRLETVAVKQGVRFVNDTTATIPDATLAAVESIDAPIHLIVGGSDKNLDFDVFRSLEVESIHLLTGNATSKIMRALALSNMACSGPHGSLEQALKNALAGAEAGSAVLLSPGCASFGMFANEFDRGAQFAELVKKLPD